MAIHAMARGRLRILHPVRRAGNRRGQSQWTQGNFWG